MSTWQIFADAGNNYRWQCADTNLSTEPQKAPIENPSSPPHLPSIADLLVQGYSKVIETPSDKVETPPTFRTGWGKLVVVKKSSLAKAASILGDPDDEAIADTEYRKLHNARLETPATFRIGSGKLVALKQPSLAKASSILNGQDDEAVADKGYPTLCGDNTDKVETPPTFHTGSGNSVEINQPSLVKASTIIGDQDDKTVADKGPKLHEDKLETPPTFRTGSGKSVAIKQSSLAKASSILNGLDDAAVADKGYPKLCGDNTDKVETPPTFHTRSGNSVEINQPSLVKASTILGDQDDKAVADKGLHEDKLESPPTFRTGSGKSVSIKQSSLAKASSILTGLDNEAVADKGYPKLCGDNTDKVETPPTFHTGSGNSVEINQLSLVKASSILGDQDDKAVADKGLHEDKLESPPTFRTGSGKSVSIKQSSLAKASSILTGLDNEAVADKGYLKLCGDNNDKVETPHTFHTGSDNSVEIKQSSLVKALTILGDQDDKAAADKGPKLYGAKLETPPTFRTGSGKSVAIKQSSLAKALSIFRDLDDDGFADTGYLKVSEDSIDKVETPPTFQTGLGKLAAVEKSSSAKSKSIIGGQGGNAFSDTGQLREYEASCLNSIFQTGSGKSVNISSAGIVKARTLLGLKENSEHHEASKCLEQSRKQANAGEIKEFTRGSMPSTSRPPPVTFHTAGGRSVKVSGDALKRARSLLGDPDVGNFLSEQDAASLVFSSNKKRISRDIALNKENNVGTFFSDGTPKIKQMSNNFISPMRQTSFNKKSAAKLEHIGSNLIKEFDAVGQDSTHKQYNDVPNPLMHSTINRSRASDDGNATDVCLVKKSSNGPLVDISNTISLNNTNNEQVMGEKRKVSSRTYPSPFKKPRSSKFITPLNKKSSLVPNGTLSKAPKESTCRRRVSTKYPFQVPRNYIKEYFGVPPYFQNLFEQLPEWLRRMNPENAAKHIFEDESGLKCIGVDSFFHMLAQSISSSLSKEWIANHYRWIVWKLACYERCYPAKVSGKLLTISNVLEELKYRYEREVNHGQRSALKRILEGDAPPSSPLVLCIASIQLKCNAELCIEVLSMSNTTDNASPASIELTDGWYSVNGLLDDLLSKQLVAGKLFVGQKLRICGAGLCGWNAPVSPLEASKMISLCLHINGTYRAHWADRLGFCKSACVPLAFKCIKGTGGVVPSTLIGVTRLYPVLYRERLNNGGYVVRSERMESKMLQLYEQRCSSITEGIMSEFQRETKRFQIDNEHNSGDEGEKISHILEQAAEPEVMLAEMSSQQLTSFATYQAKIEATRQSEIQKSIKEALEEAGLSKREVNTLMRVRVVGLTSKSNLQQCSPKQGLITIWNPTEKQETELVEGEAYAVTGLTPISSDSDTIYLHARGSTTKWRPLSPSTTEQFQPFFSPRKPVSLSEMGKVPLSSEFDVAAFVIYVGEVHKSGHQKKQWVFVTDDSIFLLAISFCSPSVSCDSIVPINYNLVGSTVGFVNLIKRSKDQMNDIWVAEATENSTYFLSYDNAHSKHLKDAAAAAYKWAKASSKTIEKLKERTLSIVAKK